ncbi:MAG: sulfotransferase domain-containing protein [Phycisphaeraceae bacterium]
MWVFSAGMPRSGSTLQFQITAELIESAGLGRRLEYARTAEFPTIRDQHHNEHQHLVFKTHHCSQDIEAQFAAGNAKAVYTFRDLRDVYASRMRMREDTFKTVWNDNFLDKCLKDDAWWRSLSPVYITRYEDMINDLPREISRLATFFNIDITDDRCTEIADRYSFDKQKQRIEHQRAQHDDNFDPKMLLHGNHLTAKPGSGWSDTLTDEQAAKIELKTRDWLTQHGYPILNPSPSFTQRLRLMFTR